MKTKTTVAAILLLGCLVHGADEESPGGEEDLTPPLTRFHLRNEFLGKSGGVLQDRTIPRFDHVVSLRGHWKISGRLDVPLLINDSNSSDNPAGRTRFGTGDLLTQVALIHSSTERFAYGLGLRMLMPTASEDQFGDGKWQLLPLAGARYSLPEVSEGSYVEPVVRYGFDTGGDERRRHVSQLRMSPTFNVVLPDQWFVTFFPSQDIVLDIAGGRRWFVPADALVGRKVGPHPTFGLEVSMPIIRDFLLYEYKVQARFSVSF